MAHLDGAPFGFYVSLASTCQPAFEPADTSGYEADYAAAILFVAGHAMEPYALHRCHGKTSPIRER